MTAFPVSLTDPVVFRETTLVQLRYSVADFVRMQDFLDAGIGRQVAVSDILNLHQDQVALTGIYMLEQILLTQTEVVNQRLRLALSEMINLREAVAKAQPVAVSDILNLHQDQLVAFAVKVLDKLGLSDLLAPKLIYRLSLAEQINLCGTIARFMGGAIIDGFTVSEVVAPLYRANAALTDNLGLNDALTPKFILRVVASDQVTISQTQVLKALLRGTVLEGIQLSAAYVAPNGSITTWAMNTRTTAVSEYRNYPFNSFAKMGHKYLGAAADGLYELDGDTDNGASIIATIRSGLTQMSGSHLGGIKAAYLAARGTGAWVLRIITGHGEVYNYAVTNQSMRSTKIHIGKGLRARFFAFELVSSGQDFDLDSLEFIPIVNARRV